MQNENQPITQYRTIWISDVHLGTRGCKAAALLDFLRRHDSETLYLVGDIFDGWQLRKSWFWTQPHNDIIQKLLRKVRKGTKVVYLPGNHDEFAQDYEGLQFGGITVQRELIHRTADGRRLLVLHGDQFDAIVMGRKWLAKLGSRAYDFTILLNHWFNMFRRRLGLRYWSLSGYLKHRVKSAVAFIGDFERTLADEARRRHCDGVVCGHIHRPEMRMVQGILYGNCGDWVESCSALVEHTNGRLEILTWTDPLADATHEPTTVIDKLIALELAG
jgi:UDP-2,3-diacylglucosamine pyrophosphatase LpxH